jgi:hypothetical protein
LAVLDEFLTQHAERLITDPLRRATFQHDLWAVFDWSDQTALPGGTASERRALQVRLAKIMSRVALSRTEIENLPDNLAKAGKSNDAALERLPIDLLQPNSPWICVYPSGGGPSAPTHVGFFRQSSFLVFLRLPGGREDTQAYLRRLDSYREPWILKRRSADGSPFISENPGLPQFPPETRVALLRQMMLLDTNGDIVPTRLIESIQSRVYKTVPADPSASGQREDSEFRLSRKLLFVAQGGGLRPVTATETGFSVFMTQGFDWFDRSPGHEPLLQKRPILQSCEVCHEGSGIHSVLTYSQGFGALQVGPLPSPGLYEASPVEAVQGAIEWAQPRRHDWGLLQGLWSR